ncbi:MAG: CDP-alcohol phosphatidyltransferase family protein [Pseudomonadales bacterium]|nr:CDP-alcohol phosphatidyltransferase family protein [Pseudomonadales bacterium]MCP5182419.1 CDP-alcohol phosphatidyltransferase family protein [Pseudomonadales bacterium]
MARLIVQLPNFLTVIRIALVVPIGLSMWAGEYRQALGLGLIAGFSDGLDGYLARRFGWQSQLGALLDPLADKVFVIVLVTILTLQGHLPLWLALIVIARDVVIMGGATVYRFLFGELDMEPTAVSKINTLAQMLLLGVVILGLCELPGDNGLLRGVADPWGFLLVALLSLWSGIDYVITWGLRTWRRKRQVA